MNRLIVHGASALILLFTLTPAYAGDARCKAAPYGAPLARYLRTLDNTKAMFLARMRIGSDSAMDNEIAANDRQITAMSENVVNGAFQSACLAKLDGVDVDKWRRSKGVADFDSMSIAELAALVILGH
jgi:hypothetical protein